MEAVAVGDKRSADGFESPGPSKQARGGEESITGRIQRLLSEPRLLFNYLTAGPAPYRDVREAKAIASYLGDGRPLAQLMRQFPEDGVAEVEAQQIVALIPFIHEALGKLCHYQGIEHRHRLTSQVAWELFGRRSLMALERIGRDDYYPHIHDRFGQKYLFMGILRSAAKSYTQQGSRERSRAWLGASLFSGVNPLDTARVLFDHRMWSREMDAAEAGFYRCHLDWRHQTVILELVDRLDKPGTEERAQNADYLARLDNQVHKILPMLELAVARFRELARDQQRTEEADDRLPVEEFEARLSAKLSQRPASLIQSQVLNDFRANLAGD